MSLNVKPTTSAHWAAILRDYDQAVKQLASVVHRAGCNHSPFRTDGVRWTREEIIKHLGLASASEHQPTSPEQ